MSPVLDVANSGRTWTFTLNRPDKLNALDAGIVDALLAAVDEAHAQNAALLVFRGAGRSFSAGFDLSELDLQTEGDLVLRFIRIEMLLQAVAASPAQTLALAHGKVFGAGVDLFAACRHRIATADAMFRMPGLRFGLVLGTRRFGDVVGKETARGVLEETSSFGTEQALAMRFVTRVAAADEWDAIIAEMRSVADSLDDVTRAALYRVLGPVEGDGLDRDLAVLVRSAARAGLKDRLQSYLDKQRSKS